MINKRCYWKFCNRNINYDAFNFYIELPLNNNNNILIFTNDAIDIMYNKHVYLFNFSVTKNIYDIDINFCKKI